MLGAGDWLGWSGGGGGGDEDGEGRKTNGFFVKKKRTARQGRRPLINIRTDYSTITV